MLYDVVITHATKDQQWAEALCEKLEKKGMRCFLGCRDIPAGSLFSVASQNALAETRMLLVAYTKNYNSTPQMNREIETATKNDIPVLTVGQADGEELLMEANRYANWIASLIGGQGMDDNVDVDDDDNDNYDDDVDDNVDVAIQMAPSTIDYHPSSIDPQTDFADQREEQPSPLNSEALGSSITPQPSFVIPEDHLQYLPEDDDDFLPEDDDMTLEVAGGKANGRIVQMPSIEAVDDANECYRIAEAYYCGNGVVQSYYEAVMWYEKAAKMGHDEAQCDLGNCYYYGEGLPENYERSVYWYEKAAEQGNVRALYNLGNSYYFGEGVPENRELALAYYDRAACLGSTHAKKRLEELEGNS